MKSLSKFGVELHHSVLNNGVNLFLFKRPGMPIYIRAAFFAGSRFDTLPGTAHFYEHMIVAGSKKFSSKNLIADYIQKVGGEFGASTSNSILRFNIEIPEASDLNVGIEVMKECLTNSLFDEKTIESERGSIISELNSKRTNPNEYIFEVFNKIAFQETDLSHSILGTEDNVRHISKVDLLNFGSKFVHTGNLVYIASGNVNIETLKEMLETIDIPKGGLLEVKESLPIIIKNQTEIEKFPGVKQLQVLYGCRTQIDTYKEYCELMLLNNVLAMGRGSRLMTKLRYKNGLVYSVNGSVLESGDWGIFRIRLSCDKDKFDTAKQLILDEFKDLKDNNITQSELDNSKTKISKGSIRDLQTSISWINSHDIDALFKPLSMKTIEDYIDVINILTLEDVDLVIQKYLNSENFYTAICGDVNIN